MARNDSTYEPPSDDLRPLIQRCLAGCSVAMFDLVKRFEGQVFGLCYHMLGQREDAEEAAQETLLRMLRSLSQWDATRAFEPWLLTIAGNRCRTALSQRKQRPPMHPLEDSQTTAREQQEAVELSEEVQRALLTLKPEHRQAFILFHEHELNYAEIAESLRVPLGTVKTWVHRARMELILQLRERQALEDHRHAMPRI